MSTELKKYELVLIRGGMNLQSWFRRFDESMDILEMTFSTFSKIFVENGGLDIGNKGGIVGRHTFYATSDRQARKISTRLFADKSNRLTSLGRLFPSETTHICLGGSLLEAVFDREDGMKDFKWER